MQSSKRNRLKIFSEMFVYAGTVAGILAVGYVGHLNHWSLNGSHASASAPNEPSTKSPLPPPERLNASMVSDNGQSPSNRLQPIVFKSPAGLENSGVKVQAAAMMDLTQELVASAEVQYNQKKTVELSSRVNGVVFRIEKQWGEKVVAGEILAIVEAGEVGLLKSEFAKTLFEQRLKKSTVDRYHDAGSAIPVRQVLEAESALQSANVALLSAEQSLVNLGFQIHHEEFENLSEDQVQSQLRLLGFSGELRKRLDQSSRSSNLLPVVSPIDGVIVSNDSTMGEAVSPSKSFMQVTDLSKVWIELDIRKEDASLVRVGQQVLFEPDGSKERIEGFIDWISTQVDNKTRTLKVRAEVANPECFSTDLSIEHYLLRANMFGQAKVSVRKKSAVTVGRECLHLDQGKTMVFIQTDPTTFEPREVRIGITQNDKVEIVGPVTDGLFVASDGSHMLKSELVLARFRGN